MLATNSNVNASYKTNTKQKNEDNEECIKYDFIHIKFKNIK